jgi:hypothetical protein
MSATVDTVTHTDEPLTTAFSFIDLSDPIMKALWEGTIRWGDIPGILDDPPHRKVENKWSDLDAQDSPAASRSPSPVRTKRARGGAGASAEKQERVVPAFTVGIKTVITRNLPRDITVEQLRGVFEKYGPIKDIYIPRNMDKSSSYFGTIKGFALVKFLKPTDSAKAFENEYGRLTIGKNNITVEFAKEDR